MKEVTDPAILAQLNDPSIPARPLKEVTDPAILAQLNDTSPQNQDDSILSTVANSPGIQAILGAGDAVRNTMASAANLLPGVNISPVQSGQGMAYDVGNIAGNIGTFMGGGELLDLARVGAEGIPLIGSIAKSLGGSGMASTISRQGIGSGIYGGLSTNQDRGDNAIIGAGEGAALSALPFGVGKIVQSQYFRPGLYAKNIIDKLNLNAAPSLNTLNGSSASASANDIKNSILNDLGSGQTLSDNAKSLTQRVNMAFKGRKEEGSGLYNSLFDNLSGSTIYDEVNLPKTLSTSPNNNISSFYTKTPLLNGLSEWRLNNSGGKIFSSGEYPSLSSDVLDSYNSNLKNMHNDFVQNPTLENAHTLQSQLGSEIRSFQKSDARGNLSISDKDVLGNYLQAKNALKTDMSNYLGKISSEYQDAYNEAKENWRTTVTPYFSRPTIAGMAKGNIENIGNIQAPFKNPSINIQRVVQDLGPDYQNKILYSQLGKMTPSSSPQNLVNAFNRLDEQGLGEYVTPQLSQRIGELQNQINQEKFLNKINTAKEGQPQDLVDVYNDIKKGDLQNYAPPELQDQIKGLQRRILATKALQVGAGAGLGSAIGNSIFGAGGWGALTGLASPQVMRFAQETLPLETMGRYLSKGARVSYPYLRQGILGQQLNNAGAQ